MFMALIATMITTMTITTTSTVTYMARTAVTLIRSQCAMR